MNIEAIDFLNQLNEYGKIDYSDYSHLHDLLTSDESEWEYGTRKTVTDGWERGDRFGEHEYIDSRSVSDKINDDRSTTLPTRDMTRAVRRRKAGPWEKLEA